MPIAELHVISTAAVCRVVSGVLQEYIAGAWVTPVNAMLLAAWNHPRRGKFAREHDGYYCLFSEPCMWDPDEGGARTRTRSGNAHPAGACRYCQAFPPGGTVYHVESADPVNVRRYNALGGNPTRRKRVLMAEDEGKAIVTVNTDRSVEVTFES